MAQRMTKMEVIEMNNAIAFMQFVHERFLKIDQPGGPRYMARWNISRKKYSGQQLYKIWVNVCFGNVPFENLVY